MEKLGNWEQLARWLVNPAFCEVPKIFEGGDQNGSGPEVGLVHVLPIVHSGKRFPALQNGGQIRGGRQVGIVLT